MCLFSVYGRRLQCECLVTVSKFSGGPEVLGVSQAEICVKIREAGTEWSIRGMKHATGMAVAGK